MWEKINLAIKQIAKTNNTVFFGKPPTLNTLNRVFTVKQFKQQKRKAP